ncbi:hypothetical protein OUZ56_007511 [Daphnia magna]|uniref:Uncharacterized protein n=1 Tax=Daphnia magna TaxID=35525 RepID=A0ABR0AA60_9CRUS|nr:hypothetical protein OUZ56_007511 [Daphnia magna]
MWARRRSYRCCAPAEFVVDGRWGFTRCRYGEWDVPSKHHLTVHKGKEEEKGEGEKSGPLSAININLLV